MDTALWPHQQEIVVKPMEEIISNTNTTTTTNSANNNNNIKPQPSTSLERKVRPQKDQAVNCPRCNSTNTKFCYYNNYSLTQPRYFCKGCRRYWTEGGSLRNIPVGGGSRKNKRPSSSSISSSSATSKIRLSDSTNHHLHQLNHVLPTNPNHHKIHIEGQDLNLGFPSTLSEFMQLPNMEAPTNPHHQFLQKNTNHMNHHHQPPNTSNNTSHLSALELLTGFTSSSSRGLMTSPFMPMHIQDPNPNSNSNPVFQTGFTLQGEFKPTLGFSLDGLHGVQESGGNGNIGGRILFPFEDLKSTTTNATTTTTTTNVDDHDHQHQNHNGDHQITRDHQQHQHGDSTGYWTGMLGGAGSW
ncbi:hypothetical protein V2J09_004876 [Rumex salicifolius]